MKRTKKERQSSFENCRSFLERATGIEPASSAWEADILPMNYARPSNGLIISQPFAVFNPESKKIL